MKAAQSYHDGVGESVPSQPATSLAQARPFTQKSDWEKARITRLRGDYVGGTVWVGSLVTLRALARVLPG